MQKLENLLYRDLANKKSLDGLDSLEFTTQKGKLQQNEIFSFNNSIYQIENISSTQYEDNITANSIIYDLKKKAFLIEDSTYLYGETSISYFNILLSTLINKFNTILSDINFAIVNNLGYDLSADFEVNEVNCLAALQQLSKSFAVEFELLPDKDINGNYQISIVKQRGTTYPNTRFIIGKEINTPTIKNSTENLVTRLIPSGSNEGLLPKYGFNTLRTTKFYPESKMDYRHSTLEYNPDLTKNITFSFEAEEGQLPTISEITNKAYQLNSEYIITQNSSSNYTLSGKFYNKYIKITIPPESQGVVTMTEGGGTDSYQKSYFNKADVAIEAFMRIDEYNWANLQSPELFFEQNIDKYGIFEKVKSFEVKPKLLRSAMSYLHFNDDYSGYLDTNLDAQEIDFFQLQVQAPTLNFKDGLYEGRNLLIKSIEDLSTDTTQKFRIHFYPLEKNQQDIVDNLRTDVTIDEPELFYCYLEDYIWIKQYDEAALSLKQQSLDFLNRYKEPEITYEVDEFVTDKNIEIGDYVQLVDENPYFSKIINSINYNGPSSTTLFLDDDPTEYTEAQLIGKTWKKILKVRISNNTNEDISGTFSIDINNGEYTNDILYSVPRTGKSDYLLYNGKILRVTEYSKNYLKNHYRYDGLVFTNIDYKNIVTAFGKIVEHSQQLKTVQKAVQSNVNFYKQQKDRINLLMKSAFKGVITDYVVVGDQDRNIVFGEKFKIIRTESTASDNGQVQFGDGAFTFTVPETNNTYTVSQKTVTLTNTNIQYVYIKFIKGDVSINGEIILDTSSNLNETTNDGYTYLVIGVVRGATTEATYPSIAMNYGLTYISGGEIITTSLSAISANLGEITAGRLRSTTTEQGSTNPIVDFDLDNGYFKIGDIGLNKFFEYDYINDTFKLRGAQLDAVNALLWTDTNITVTVGANGDFSNISQALEYLSKFWVTHRSDNQTINGFVKILSGHTVNDFIVFENVDLGWIQIISEDVDVPLVKTTSWTPFIYAVNSTLPEIRTHFLCDGIFSDTYGIMTLENSTIKIGKLNSTVKYGFSRGGIQHPCDIIVARRGSNVISFNADYKRVNKIIISDSRWIAYLNNLQEISEGFVIQYASVCDFGNCDFTGATLHNIKADHASRVNVDGCIFEPTLNPNVEVHGGSKVDVTSSLNVNPSQTINTITKDGIISSFNVTDNFANKNDISGFREFLSVSRIDTSDISDTSVAESYMNTNYGTSQTGTTAQLRQTWSGSTYNFYLVKFSVGWKSLYRVLG